MMTRRRSFLKNTGLGFATALAAAVAVSPSTAEENKPVKRKIIGINTSHRPGKTSTESLRYVLDAVQKIDASFETELLELATMRFGFPVFDGTQQPDDLDGVIAKLTADDCAGFVIASPVYMGLPTARCVALLDRFQPLRKNFALKNKVCGLVAVASGRNGGQETVLHAMHNSLIAQQVLMAVDGPPTSHWGGTFWNQNDTVAGDEYGINIARNLAARIVELVKMQG